MQIQHPYEPGQRIALNTLLDLLAHELEVIGLDDESPRTGTELLNNVVERLTDPAEKEALTAALCARFIGD